MEQQVPSVQPQALPADIEAILQPLAAEPTPSPLSPPMAEPVLTPAPAPQPVPVVPAPAPAPHTVPLPEMLEQRHRAQLAEERNKWLEGQLNEFRQSQEAQRRASQPQPQPIDPVADPEGAFRAVAQTLAQERADAASRAVHLKADTSEMIAREKFGDPAVDAAVEAAKQAGLGNVFLHKQRPYQELMTWHNSQTIAQQVGPDLKAWETKKEAEIEARVLARLQQAAAPARPGVPQVLPPSLASATRANIASPVVQDTGDFFKSMFAKPQRPT